MGKVTVDQIRRRLEDINRQRSHYEWKSQQPGRLTLHEVWRHAYLARPYLIGAPDDRVEERFCSIFLNVSELNKDGKISPVLASTTDEFMQTFTHMLEEYSSRIGGLPKDLIGRARKPIVKYFQNGTPIGAEMFRDYRSPSTPIIVKYGRRQFLEPMFRSGDLRVANASLYSDTKLLDSVRDDETSRTFFIPTFKDRLAGRTHLMFQGSRIEFDDDDIVLPLIFDDYYLFSLCNSIHYRMPTDFGADAAIVIKEPMRFKQRLISAFLTRLPDYLPMEGAVTYYDPYRDYSKFRVPEMAKHFGYAYQKEERIVFRPRKKALTPLEPIFLSIGSMSDYADFISV
jgi:hypothetical protein